MRLPIDLTRPANSRQSGFRAHLGDLPSVGRSRARMRWCGGSRGSRGSPGEGLGRPAVIWSKSVAGIAPKIRLSASRRRASRVPNSKPRSQPSSSIGISRTTVAGTSKSNSPAAPTGTKDTFACSGTCCATRTRTPVAETSTTVPAQYVPPWSNTTRKVTACLGARRRSSGAKVSTAGAHRPATGHLEHATARNLRPHRSNASAARGAIPGECPRCS